jgi:hypothetical protein
MGLSSWATINRPTTQSLAELSAVLRARPRLGKVRVGILEHFVLIPVTYLALQIGTAIVGRLAGFFFYRALLSITVWVFLFWHGA